MRPARVLFLLFLIPAVALGGCKKKGDMGDEAKEKTAEKKPDTKPKKEKKKEKKAENTAEKDSGPDQLKGRVRPGKVTEVYPAWRERVEEVKVAEEMAKKLKDVAPGAAVTVYFGPWCSDSRREVPRLWKGLELAGGDVPFSVEYIALDREFDAGDVSLEGLDVTYVPTFVVKREGEEVGRIVESPEEHVVSDLAALLNGEKEGVISGREDL